MKGTDNNLKRGFIRPAQPDDCSFIRKLSGEVFSQFGDYSEIMPQWFVDQAVITFICADNKDRQGFAILHGPSREILAIAVDPACRRMGIGTTLLNEIEFLAPKLGLNWIMLHTARENKAARLFFRNAGFEVIETRERYYPKGQPALTMVKHV